VKKKNSNGEPRGVRRSSLSSRVKTNAVSNPNTRGKGTDSRVGRREKGVRGAVRIRGDKGLWGVWGKNENKPGKVGGTSRGDASGI